jgi:hypothetical protein
MIPSNCGELRIAARNAAPTLAVGIVGILLGGCREYRIEHHKRPSFYQKASEVELPSQVVMPDGTIVKYEAPSEQSTLGRSGKDANKTFEARAESEDALGNKVVTVRALLPEHLVVNTLTCMRNQEYDLLWDQVLAKPTKAGYAAIELDEHDEDDPEPPGDGRDIFIAFMRKHRHELVATLTRMVSGMSGQEVAIEPIADNTLRCRLRPQIAEPFVFKSLDMVKEDGWWKLLVMQ